MKNVLKLSLLAGLTALVTPSAFANDSIVTIGTGGQTGVYFVVGQSICQLVNRDTAKTGVKCNAPSTGGSIANINSLAANQITFGISQADIQYNVYHGKADFEGKANPKLRSVFSLYPEAFTILARHDAKIQNFEDLQGKRVNVGNPGSGTRNTFDVLLRSYGWTTANFSLASELRPAEMASNLCDNNLDAISYTVGHPNGAIKEASATCNVNLVDVKGSKVDQLIAANPYYAKIEIPANTYKGSKKETTTIGVYATLVTTSDASDKEVYEVVKAVFSNFDRFKRLHPSFANLTKESMVQNSIFAPLHPGAVKYYKEVGLLK